ncbi:MFS transporter, CP family, cyanate transporter [Franzmannia pantelleriensis]|uniref:MFS transporter, CP family, cyanate transporter n=1 Tax=Franzmannia pantelleriensis TaxID=48727 RepID=A0A1G9EL04_9GAMM|nr:MFS transporter [Halomonas pantelleriensis]SDK76840.1 MFS transporter, CP family, cyanate transporter [Halomonas pantelleriensis]
MSETTFTAKRPARRMTLFICLMILVGLNLRPALSSLAPLLGRIQQDTGLTPLGVGALTTLPVLCLGLFAPLAPRLSRRMGAERALSLGLLVLAVALAVRALPSLWLLFLGTLMVGGAIGVCGSLLPGLVKRELPRGADLMTGVYTMALCLGGALGAGISIPLADLLGSWQMSLASWMLLALAALLAWRLGMPQSRPDSAPTQPPSPPVSLLHSRLAWQVTGFMGSQSSLAYIVFGWLPVLMQRRGLSEGEAGWLLAMSVMSQLLAALGAPWLARLGRDQRLAALVLMATSAAGLLILLLGALEARWLGAALLGIGQGGSFSLALTLIVLRSGTHQLAGQLSGMVQGIGYCMAAAGPLSVGLMLQFGADNRMISLLLMVIITIATSCAMLAGRQRRLDIEQGQLVTRRGR